MSNQYAHRLLVDLIIPIYHTNMYFCCNITTLRSFSQQTKEALKKRNALILYVLLSWYVYCHVLYENYIFIN